MKPTSRFLLMIAGLALAGADVASAQVASTVRRGVPGTLTVKLECPRTGGADRLAGVTLSLHQREVLGIPRFLALATTRGDGYARLALPPGARGSLVLTLWTTSDLVSTHGRSPLRVPHFKRLKVDASETLLEIMIPEAQEGIAYFPPRWTPEEGTTGGALRVQDAAHRALSFGRRAFTGLLDVEPVTARYPHPGHNGRSYARGASLMCITADGERSSVAHEVGHLLYAQAGLAAASCAHRLNQALDPQLAFSEGFADFFAAASGVSRSLPAGGEAHVAHKASATTRARYRVMGQHNEANVAAALFDLADDDADQAGVAPWCTDRVSGLGVRGVLKDVVDGYGSGWKRFWRGKPTLKKLHERSWRPRYGWRATETLELNGVTLR